jgi:hypothetical protein
MVCVLRRSCVVYSATQASAASLIERNISSVENDEVSRLVNDSQTDRVNVPEIVHSKWDEMLGAYNPIIAKINQITRSSPTFKTSSERIVDANEFASRMGSAIYRLYWACKSLEWIMDFYEKHTKSMHDAQRGVTEALPDIFNFNADVFFSFAYSALDIIAEVIHMMIQTGIQEDRVYFTSVLDFLTSSRSAYVDDTLNDLRRESDTGWIHEFRQHRKFVTHHGTVRTRSRFKYTAKEINLHVLPDDPKKRPHTYTKKRELAPYCLEVIVKELDVVRVLFEFVGKLISDKPV